MIKDLRWYYNRGIDVPINIIPDEYKKDIKVFIGGDNGDIFITAWDFDHWYYDRKIDRIYKINEILK